MKKLIIKFLQITILTNSLLWTTMPAYAQSASTDITGAAVNSADLNNTQSQQSLDKLNQAYDMANSTLQSDQAKLSDAQAGIDRNLINRRQQELQQAQSQCPGFVPGDGAGVPDQGTCNSQAAIQAITTATTNLADAKTPHYDPGLVASLQQQVNSDQAALIQADHNKEYGMETANGAAALQGAMDTINSNIKAADKGSATDIFNNPNQSDYLKPVSDAVVDAKLAVKDASKTDEDYKAQLQQDVIMVIIGQVTSRLNACSAAPDMTMGIGAGQAFVTGESAVYADTRYLQDQMKTFLAQTPNIDKQKAYLQKLLAEYQTILDAAQKKKNFRTLSKTAFKNAAALATSEEVEDQSWENACSTQNSVQSSQGKNQGSDYMILFAALAAMYYSYPYCAGCAAAIAVLVLKALADKDKNNCSSGASQTAAMISTRKTDCNRKGTPDMLRTWDLPTATASKYIKDTCIEESKAVSAHAGQGCSGYSSNGAGPYNSCDKAADAYSRNLVACPVDILSSAEGDTNTTAVVGTGVASGAVGAQASDASATKDASFTDVKVSGVDRAFIAKSSINLARNMDLRMASPLQRSIIWTAFSQIADNASNINDIEIGKITDQISAIQKLLDELNKQQNGVATNNANSAQTVVSGQQLSIHASSVTSYKLPGTTSCITGVASTSCKSVTEALQAMPSFANMPASLQAASGKVAAGLNAINHTNRIDAAGIAAMRGASGSSGAIISALAKSSNQLQAILKNTGSDMNLNAEAANAKNSVISNIANEAKKAGSGSSFYNQFANGAGTGDGSSAAGGAYGGAKAKIKFGGMSVNSSGYNAQAGNGAAKNNFGSGVLAPDADGKNQTGALTEDGAILSKIIEARNQNGKTPYSPTDDDTIFQKLTKAYIRNYDKILTKKTMKPQSN